MNYDEYIQQLDQEGKICLQGKYWDDAFKIIIGSKKRDNSILPNPLVLSGWHYSDDQEKSDRFRKHVKYAFDNGKAMELINFIIKCPEDGWYFKEGF